MCFRNTPGQWLLRQGHFWESKVKMQLTVYLGNSGILQRSVTISHTSAVVHSVMSNSLQPHGLQHTRHPCPSPSLGAHSNSVHWVGDVIQPSHPLLLLSSIFPSIRVFSNELALCVWWPKYWSFRLSISPSNEYSGLISFRIDWFDLLAV